MKEIPLLTPDDIEVRVAQVFYTEKTKGVSLLLYKNARCDMKILDDVFCPENWQREHYECKGNLFCRVGIKVNNEWIWKSDCGSESYTEKEKGEASDSFKRACVNWGLGRELYTAPFIWIDGSKCEITSDKKCKTMFSVFEIDYDDKRKIDYLTIINKKTGDLLYKFGTPHPKISTEGFSTSEKAKGWNIK